MSLSLKAKGLHSLMLSLPDQWDFSLKGLAKISRDGESCIGTALKELEKHGYLTRRHIRDNKGKYVDVEYTIHENPVKFVNGAKTGVTEPVTEPVTESVTESVTEPATEPDRRVSKSDNPEEYNQGFVAPYIEYPDEDYPELENPNTDNPNTDSPDMDGPSSENRRQLSTISNQVLNNQRTKKSSINQSIRSGAGALNENNMIDRMDRMDGIDIYREILMENIAYYSLCEQHPYSRDIIEELLEIMLEIICSTKKTIRVCSEDKPAKLVKNHILMIGPLHIEYILKTLSENTTDVKNIKSYLMTTIFNAISTKGSYFMSKVNHDLYGDNGDKQSHETNSYSCEDE
jgi:hypothetical protein